MRAGLAHDFHEAGAGELRGDDFGGERDAGQQPAEFRVRVRAAPVQKVAFNSCDRSFFCHECDKSNGIAERRK